MTFEDSQKIFDTLKELKKVPDWITQARKYHKKQKSLIYGDDYKELILQIQHIETEKKAKARRRYARPIKDINAKILEPVSNVYSATGGGKEYNISNENEKTNFIKELANVRGGMSLEKWLEKFWSKDLYNVDPSGLMFLEWKDDKAWPTYKSIDVIRYYKANGLNIDFVVFEPKQGINGEYIWRVVDSEKDYTVIEKGDVFTVDEENTFDNPFGRCPGRVSSDKIQLGKEYRLAFNDNIIETQEEFISDRSILTIYKFLNGFSTPYKPVVLCPSCHGTGKNGTKNCPDCDGKGMILRKDVTDEILLPIKLDAENPLQLPANFAGFISPDLEIWNKYREEAKDMFKEMFETTWGTRESDEVKDQTAMGVILNTQPMISKLNAISDVAQSHEWAFTEMLANFHMPNKDKDERISIITYGRNYIIQPPEFLLKEYQESKKNNDAITILDRKLLEYITSKYKNDPETLRVELMKKQLEPYVHYNIELVNDIYGNIEARKKGLFADWWESLKSSDKDKTIEQLEKDRDKWMEEKTSGNNNQNEE